MEEATGVLVSPGDAEAMATGIVTLLSNDALRKRLGENAARDAQRRFDLERQVKAYLEWYHAIVECQNTERSTFQPTNVQRGFHALPNPE